jgi:hypothetical protein
MLKKITLAFFAISIFTNSVSAQSFKDGKLTLNESGSHYFKITALSQVWLRDMTYNPGSTLFGYSKEKGADLGIRRYRVQLYGQLTDRVFIYSQIGENNFSNTSDRKLGFFVHDASGEYAIVKNKLSMGAGLNAWSGLSRFSSPSAGTILGVDAPLFLQSTNDITDQFLRKLSVYAKGKLGKLDYRISLADPMSFQKSTAYSATVKPISNFSSKPPKMQLNAYLQYQFKEQESNLTPYMVGSYLGKKKVFNIGGGVVYQPQALWHLAENAKDTVLTNMMQIAVDVFYDVPVGTKGQAISVYGNVTSFNFGPNYTRNQAVMNPVNGTTNANLMNGSGNGFPAIGTGTEFYTQAGYKLKDNALGKNTFMPYASIQSAKFERLNHQMNYIDLGLNMYMAGNASKLTAAYQNRPLFDNLGNLTERKGGFILQFQTYFN